MTLLEIFILKYIAIVCFQLAGILMIGMVLYYFFPQTFAKLFTFLFYKAIEYIEKVNDAKCK